VNGAYRGEEAVLLGINAAEYNVRDHGQLASSMLAGRNDSRCALH